MRTPTSGIRLLALLKPLRLDHRLYCFLIRPACVLTESAASTLYLERLDVGVQVASERAVRVAHGLGRRVLVALILTSLELVVLEACVSVCGEVRPVAAQKRGLQFRVLLGPAVAVVV